MRHDLHSEKYRIDETAGVPSPVLPLVTDEESEGGRGPGRWQEEPREERSRRERLLAMGAVNPPDIKRSHIPVDRHANLPFWVRRHHWDFVDHDGLDRLNL